MTGVFELQIDSRTAHDLEVVSFRGRERLSRPYAFDILLRGRQEDSTATVVDLLGKPAHLRLGGERGRTIHGILRRVEAESTSGGGEGVHVYRATLAPRFWLLGRRKNSRIFQNLSVREIVDRVLDERHLERRWALAATYMPRIYCVQYEETDAAFISRLLAEEGMFFHFEHPDAGPESMVICDSAALVQPLASGDRFVFRDSGGMEEIGDEVHRFGIARRVRSGKSFLRDFDFLRPSHPLDASSAEDPEMVINSHGIAAEGFDETRLEVYDHHGEFFGFGVDEPAARVHLEQHRRKVALAEGQSRSVHLAPGASIALTGAPLTGQDGRYSIVSVEHEGHVPERVSREAHTVYQNRFEAVPEMLPFRPKRPERRLQQVMETATVVGPQGHEIHTDEHGRIKVQFHWDREGRKNEHSSCWMRTMQPWSGAGWGFQFLPRVGMEVLVTFIGGDVDKPVVVGCVPNAEHPMPFPLPQNKTKSGIRTETTPGGNGHNLISFEDRRRHEEICIRAQRNFTEIVLHDHSTTVGSSQTTRVAGPQTDIVGGNRHEIVSQNRWSEIQGNDVTQVNGTRSATVEENDRTVVEGNVTCEITGGEMHSAGKRSTVIRTDDSLSIGGSQRRVVAGADEEVVGGAQTVRVGGALMASYGSMTVSSMDTITFNAKNRIVFNVGGSTVELTTDGVTVTGKTVVVCGTSRTTVCTNHAQLQLESAISAVGDSISLESSGAGLTLDSSATLKGSQVALKGGGGSSKSSSSSSSQSPPPPPKLQFSIFVGQGSSDDGKALVIRRPDGSEVSRIAASSATSSTDRFRIFEVDPAEHEGQIEITWETPEGVEHVAGPMDAKEVRDSLVGDNVRKASAMMRKRTPGSAQASYTKEVIPDPDVARAPRNDLPIGGPGSLSPGHSWLSPTVNPLTPEDILENAFQAAKDVVR